MLRRHFIGASALAALPFPAAAAQDTVVDKYPQDAWLDEIKGKHRLFFDATDDREAAGALAYAWNYMRTSQTGYQEKDEDQAIVICLRHAATAFAFSNELWAKHEYLRKHKYVHPETEKKVKGGNAFRPGSTSPKSADDAFTLDAMARRGVHFAICGAATRGLAGILAGKGASKEQVAAMEAELKASAVANAHFMASGILAAQRAGEYGYPIIKG